MFLVVCRECLKQMTAPTLLSTPSHKFPGEEGDRLALDCRGSGLPPGDNFGSI